MESCKKRITFKSRPAAGSFLIRIFLKDLRYIPVLAGTVIKYTIKEETNGYF